MGDENEDTSPVDCQHNMIKEAWLSLKWGVMSSTILKHDFFFHLSNHALQIIILSFIV